GRGSWWPRARTPSRARAPCTRRMPRASQPRASTPLRAVAESPLEGMGGQLAEEPAVIGCEAAEIEESEAHADLGHGGRRIGRIEQRAPCLLQAPQAQVARGA